MPYIADIPNSRAISRCHVCKPLNIYVAPFETRVAVDDNPMLIALPFQALRLEVCGIWGYYNGKCNESSKGVWLENTRGLSALDVCREDGHEDVGSV